MVVRHRLVLLVLLLLSCTLHLIRAFENPFAKWLEAPVEPLEEEVAHQQVEEGQPEDLLDEERNEEVEEEAETPSEAIQPPLPNQEPETQSLPYSTHYDPEPQLSAAIVEEPHVHDRRLEEVAAPDDEPDEFAGLEGIDLSPFNMYAADKAVLVQLLDWAYDRTAYLSRFKDGFVHAEELSRLFSMALNPTQANVPDEYIQLIDAAADEMRAVQGLLDDEMAVPRGFVGRGMPLRTLQRLAQQMHEYHTQRNRRRLTEVASIGTRDREL